jgi:hypothetical protein
MFEFECNAFVTLRERAAGDRQQGGTRGRIRRRPDHHRNEATDGRRQRVLGRPPRRCRLIQLAGTRPPVEITAST